MKEKKSEKKRELDPKLIKEINDVIKLNKKHNGPKQANNTEGCIFNLTDVNKKYTNGYIVNHVLKDINIEIKEGEFVVILGKSGSGKTTLMNILSGLNRATTGDVIVNGFNLTNLSNAELTSFRRKYVGYIFQEYGLLSTLNVYENVLAGFNLNKKGNNKSIVDETLKLVNLYEWRKKFPSELSGGQQQRVAIARAIAKNPKIIFGDEPTGAVDSKMSKTILKILKDINRKKNTTVVIITHDSNIAKIADKVFYVIDGMIQNVTINANPIEPEQL